MEHIIRSQIMKHLNKHKILLNTQHGFRMKSSGETQLLLTVATKRSHGILLDFAKAFDKIARY